LALTPTELRDIDALTVMRSGSVGNVTYSRNHGGPFRRDRVVPANPNTALQLTMRRRFRTLNRTWLFILTPAQRAGWNTYAFNVPVRDRLGEFRRLTGHNHFIRSNYTRMRHNNTYRRNAPQVYNLGEFTAFQFVIETPPPIFRVQFDESDNWWGEVNTWAMISVTVLHESTVNSFVPPYRFWAAIGALQHSPTIIPPLPGPIVGQCAFVKVQIFRADGRASYLQRTRVLVRRAD
jgi:hypothetical protein